MQIAFLAIQACEMLHAITITLVRVASQKAAPARRETAAASTHRSGVPRLRAFMREMVASPLVAFGSAALVAAIRPGALAISVPVLALWAAAPLIAYALSRPAPTRRAVLGAEDRLFLESVALKTWRYFETFAGLEDHALPPDNVQVVPDVTIAHRTSPTNIGMALLATVAAHDFGFIDAEDMARRIDATLTTVESLERVEGHLLNWYDTRTLAPLPPFYISTVDSGNLAGALLTLTVALRELRLDDGRSCGCTVRRDELRLRLRPAATAVHHRLSPGRRGGAGPRSLHYDLLASESRLPASSRSPKATSRVALVPPGRAVTSVRGALVLLSWSATMFEY